MWWLAPLLSLTFSAVDLSVLNVPVVHAEEKVWTTEELKTLITETAKMRKLHIGRFLATATCEVKKNEDGSWDYKAQSDHTTKKGRENSWGLWQINLDAHPDITKEQARDPLFSTRFASDEWEKGNAWKWTCYNNLYGKNRVE